MWAPVRTCRGPAPPAAPPGRWTPAPPPPAAAPCRDRAGLRRRCHRPRWAGGARHRRCVAPGPGEAGGGVGGWGLPVRRLRLLTGRRHLPSRPGTGSEAAARAQARGELLLGDGVAAAGPGVAGPRRERSGARLIPPGGGSPGDWVSSCRGGAEVRPAGRDRAPGGGPGSPRPGWSGAGRGDARGEGKPRPFGSGVAGGAALPSQHRRSPSPSWPAVPGAEGPRPTAAGGGGRGEGRGGRAKRSPSPPALPRQLGGPLPEGPPWRSTTSWR